MLVQALKRKIRLALNEDRCLLLFTAKKAHYIELFFKSFIVKRLSVLFSKEQEKEILVFIFEKDMLN